MKTIKLLSVSCLVLVFFLVFTTTSAHARRNHRNSILIPLAVAAAIGVAATIASGSHDDSPRHYRHRPHYDRYRSDYDRPDWRYRHHYREYREGY